MKKILFVFLVSGGPDSMLAFHFVYNFCIYKLNNNICDTICSLDEEVCKILERIVSNSLIDFLVLHYNHKVRQESDKEAIFLKDYFEKKKISIIIGERDVGNSENVFKLTEDYLRKKRRNWIWTQVSQFLGKYDEIFIITGHNLTDRIETTFLNMLRGCSLKGFLNMSMLEEVNNHRQWCQIITDNLKINQSQTIDKGDNKIGENKLSVIENKIVCNGIYLFRPLLNLPKDKIQFLCDRFNIPYFVDKTNIDETVSKRNKIRKIIFELANLANITKDGKNLFYQSWKKIYKELSENFSYNLSKDIEIFGVYQDWWDKLGVSFLKEVKFNKNLVELTVDDIVEVLNKLRVYRDITESNLKELLKFFQKSESGWKQFKGLYFIKTVGRIFVTDKLPKKGFTGDVLKNESLLIVRYPKEGDKFKGKSLTKYLNILRVPSFLRGWVKVFEKDGKIVKIDPGVEK